MQSISIKFPFKETEEGGIISVNKTELERIQTNLIAFFTLQKGQRVMHNDLYSPLYDFIMESWDELMKASLSDAIQKSFETFFTDLELQEIQYNFDEMTNVLGIKISYYVIDLKVNDNIEMNLPLEL